MDRREFISVSGAAAAAAMVASTGQARAQGSARDYYELRKYILDTDTQKRALGAYLENAAIPALNRIGVSPIGVFETLEDLSPLVVLLCHRSAESYVTATQKLLADSEYLAKGADFLNLPNDHRPYARIETSFMVAFEGMPVLKTPVTSAARIFEMRNYESYNVDAGQRKVAMFNKGEIGVMEEVGMNPVFYGEHLAGPVMPNLTYMLSYDGMDARAPAWARFGPHPTWQKMSTSPEYADTVSNITQTFLKPTSYSQI